MTRYRLSLVLGLAAGAVWLGTRGQDAAGCAVAPRPGARVSTADESAYIVWDEKTKTEHFIRRASFASSSADFGFLVPSPGAPELDVADDALFRSLAALTAPKVEYREQVVAVERPFGPGCASESHPAAAMDVAGAVPKSAERGGVEVLGQQRVGDYDATVLKFRRGAEDAAAGAAELTKWLNRHGYTAPAPVTKWLEWYVQNEWCLTTFKIAAHTKHPDGTTSFVLQAKPIRMSFQTDRPFYPYREPASEGAAAASGSRLLRVFVAAPWRAAGSLGDGSGAWPGQAVWAGRVGTEVQQNLFTAAKLPAGAEGWWLTEFEDRSSPRPGTDEVFFARAADQSELARPPHVITTRREVVVTPWWHGALYVGVPCAAVAFALLLWRLTARAG